MVKHTKFLHRPDFDLKCLVGSTFMIGNCTSSVDPILLQSLVKEIQNKGRMKHVYLSFKNEAPGRSDTWRDDIFSMN